MGHWFKSEKIDNKTFVISEYGHYLETHTYLFLGTKRAALVDSGLGIGNIKKEIEKLTKLPILVITTHAHPDHIGGHAQFQEIAVHQDDQDLLEKGLEVSSKEIKAKLFKKPFTKDLPHDFDPEKFKLYKGSATQILKDNDVIDLGNRTLVIIHTPGHSPGHVCLYEPETGYLTTGDLLYEGRINASFAGTDPKELLTSLRKIKTLPRITKLLPAHHKLDIPVSFLDEAISLLEKLDKEGNLKHGAGLYKSQHLSLLL